MDIPLSDKLLFFFFSLSFTLFNLLSLFVIGGKIRSYFPESERKGREIQQENLSWRERERERERDTAREIERKRERERQRQRERERRSE